MRFGLFVEGRSDKLALETLARKALGQSRTAIEPREIGNDVRSFDAIRRHMDALLNTHRDVSKVIVCADLHSDRVMKGQIDATERALNNVDLPVQVRYVKVLHALEGWLLADPDAIKETLGLRTSPANIPGDLESRCDQVEILEELFRRNGKEYKKVRWAPTLASHADPSAIAARMSSFQEFVNALKDP